MTKKENCPFIIVRQCRKQLKLLGIRKANQTTTWLEMVSVNVAKAEKIDQITYVEIKAYIQNIGTKGCNKLAISIENP